MFIENLPASKFNTIEAREEFFKQYADYCHSIGHKEYGKKNFFDEIRKTGRFTERRISGEWCFVPVENIKADSE